MHALTFAEADGDVDGEVYGEEEGGEEAAEGEGQWYYTLDGVDACGPVLLAELGSLKASGALAEGALLWCDGIDGLQQPRSNRAPLPSLVAPRARASACAGRTSPPQTARLMRAVHPCDGACWLSCVVPSVRLLAGVCRVGGGARAAR
jgi:hypothetical protein